MPFISLSEGDCYEAAESLPGHILKLWKKLALGTDQGDPVCCAPSWNLAYHDVFHPKRKVFYFSGNNSLILLGEYRNSRNEVCLVPIEDSWMFGQPLLGSSAPELLVEALEILAADYAPYLPPVFLSGIREEKEDTLFLFRTFSKEFNFYRQCSTTQCAASLEGGLDGWLSRRSANHRAKLKKAMREAREAGIYFERHCPEGKREAARIYERMINVELQSWKGVQHCGMAESPSKEFYAALLKRLSGVKSARVIFARIEDKDLGFIFGSTCGSIYRGQQFSYALDYGKFSPGNLMQLEKIRWLCELGLSRYDMGPITGPRMEYKQRWTEQTRTIQTWMMRRAI